MSCLLRALVAIVAIAASVGLAGSAPAGAAPDRRLLVVADSVALGAAPAIRAAFAGWDVAIEGHQGIFTNDAAELAWAHRDEIGTIAVVATGYNYPVWNPTLFDGWIDQMMGRLVAAGAEQVFWLTLREPPLGEHGVVSVWEQSGIANHYPTANAQLRAAKARWHQLALADWNAVAGGPGLTWDGLHVTPAGGAAMADLLVDEVVGIGRLPGLAIVPLGADGTACLFTYAGAHLVVDVAGWIDAASPLRPVTPLRVADTRTTGARLAAGGVMAVPLPAGASRAMVTATAVDPARAGYLTAYPCGTPAPTASVLNYEAKQVVANLAVVAAGAGGQVCVTSYAPADVVVDLAAWAGPGGTSRTGGPVRLADTRRT